MKKLSLLLISALLAFLTACGGGGGGATSSPANVNGVTTGGTVALTLSNFTVPANADAGTNVAVSVTIANTGSEIAYGVVIHLYLSQYPELPSIAAATDVVLTLDPGQSVTKNINLNIPTTPLSGSYYVTAQAIHSGGNAGLVASTININGSTCSMDTAEPDNSWTTAKMLSNAVTVFRNHCDDSSDWFAFNATAGTKYGLLLGLNNESDHTLKLVDKDGSTILQTIYTFGMTPAKTTWTPQVSGTYYIQASPLYGVYSSGPNTDYDLTVSTPLPDLTMTTFYAWNGVYPGSILELNENITNQGFMDATSFEVNTYLSTDSVIDTNDILLGSRTIASLAIDQTSYSGSLGYSLPMNLVPGTYYVGAIINPAQSLSELSYANNASASQAITVDALPGCSIDSYEADDSVSTASQIVASATAQAHNHCEDAVDWLKFDAIAGKSYFIGITGSWFTITLYDTTGTNQLATQSASSNPSINWTAPATGTYYFKVTGFSEPAGAGRDYTVKMEERLPELTQKINFYGAFYGVYPGGLINISDEVVNSGYIASGPFNVSIYRSTDAVADASDTLVVKRSITDLAVTANNSLWTTLLMPKDLVPGTYYLYAVADSDQGVAELIEGNNTSSMLAVAVSALPGTCTWDAYEDDEFYTMAKAISAGTPQSRNFCDDEHDFAKFTAPTDGTYLVMGTSVVSGLDFYAADGTTYIPPHAINLNYQASLVATAGTTYYFDVSNAGTGEGTNYTLSVSKCTLDAYEEDDDKTASKTITVGSSQTRNHCDDNADWASFSATSGTSYSIVATDVGSSANTRLALYAADGTFISYSNTTGSKHTINFTAPASSTYYIEAYQTTDWGLNREYTLSLN